MIIKNDLSGKKINRLLVIETIPRKLYDRTKYKCLCDCGNEVIIEGSKITNGHTKSCGCYKDTVDYGAASRKPAGESNKKTLIYNYKHNANYKGFSFDLTDEQVVIMFQSNCYYCGSEPRFEFKKKGSNGGYKYTGIDRLDSKKGYSTDNVVPCCSKCNFIKNKYHHDDFIKWVETVYNNLKTNKIL